MNNTTPESPKATDSSCPYTHCGCGALYGGIRYHTTDGGRPLCKVCYDALLPPPEGDEPEIATLKAQLLSAQRATEEARGERDIQDQRRALLAAEREHIHHALGVPESNIGDDGIDSPAEIRSLKAALAQARGEWVACSERMPDRNRYVLIAAENSCTPGDIIKCSATFDPEKIGQRGEWYSRDDGWSVHVSQCGKVTHWRALPPHPPTAQNGGAV